MTAAATVLGVDPGLRRTGYGVIVADGGQLRHIAHGMLTAPLDAPLPLRLAALFDALTAVIARYAPQAIAVEQVFVNSNAQATLLLGQARGALLAAAVRSGAPVAEYTALQVKQAVVGYGKAHKEQVQEMVRRLLSLTEPPPPDAADALACAICHAHQSRHPLAAALLAHGGGVSRKSGRLRGWSAEAVAALAAQRGRSE